MAGMLNFFEAPRAVGNPLQKIVNTTAEIAAFVDETKGKAPVFISHNSYPTLQNGAPYQVNVNKLFLDFDNPRKPENAQLDVLKLLDFCDLAGIPAFPAFSGSKGFHLYIPLKPEVYLFGTFLKDAVRAIHLWLQRNVELRTIDLNCAEPRRLCRVWYTPHAKRDKKSGEMVFNGMYCCPVKPEWIRDWKIDDIMEYARAPKEIEYKPSGELLTLVEFLDRFGINPREELERETKDETIVRSKLAHYIPVSDEYIKMILPQPCLHTQMVNNPNPQHQARFATAVWFKHIGMTNEWTFKFFKDRNFIDHKDEVCAYQINNIYSGHYKPVRCKKLFLSGACIGKECKEFANFAKKEHIILGE